MAIGADIPAIRNRIHLGTAGWTIQPRIRFAPRPRLLPRRARAPPGAADALLKPEMYRSPYGDRCEALAATLVAQPAARVFCIFDNTASGAALGDALELKRRLRR